MSKEELKQAVGEVEQKDLGLTPAEKIIVDEAERIAAEDELNDKTETRLAKAFGIEVESEPTSDDEPAGKEDESTKTTSEEVIEDVTDTTVEDDSDDDPTLETDEDEPTGDEDGDEDGDGKKTPAGDEPTPEIKTSIPEPYIRAAIHSEWTREEITALEKKDPELALKTCKKLYDSMNRLSSEFAELGRNKISAQKPNVDPVKPAEEKPAATSKIDIKKLKDEYGDDPIVGVIEALITQNESLQNRLGEVKPNVEGKPRLSKEEAVAQVRAEDNLRSQLNSFFSGDDMKIYGDFYGGTSKGENSWDKLTVEQQQHRWDVITLADQICHGALALGKNITVDEAMNRAHLSVSKDVLEKAIKDGIKKQVKSRTKTLQPKNATPVKLDKVAKPEDLEKKVAARLAATFKK